MIRQSSVYQETIYQKSQMEKDFLAIRPAIWGGRQWRRVRTIQNDINELKKQVKPAPITPDGKSVESSPPSPLELQIQQLVEV